MVDSVVDYAIFVLDTNGVVISWNLGAERLKGYKPQEIIGKHFSIFFTPADLAKDKPSHELIGAAEAGRFEDEGWRVRKDGSRFWANVILTRILDESGNLIGFGKITRDLTNRRQAELRYRLLVKGVIDYAIYSMDVQGKVGSWNLGAERMKGYKANEIVGKHFSIFYRKEDVEGGMPDKVLETAAKTGHFEGEGWRVRKDGSRFWASVVVTALRDDIGKLYGFSKVTRDISERKALQDALQQHADELELRVREREQSNAELEAFAYSVSHDLRAPLRAIAGFAEALRQDYDARLDDGGRDYLNEIIAGTARMNTLVQDLLDYGRVSRIDISLEPVKLLDVVNDAVRQLGDERSGSLVVDIAPELRVQAQKQVLTQMVFNLLSNAFKFHSGNSNPEVRLSAQPRNGCIRLSVRDNGIGIASQHQQRIWQVFERLHDRESYPGTGIGLAIVNRAVARMQGNRGVESEVGKGSTFWVELPLAPENSKENHA
jgi:PAS domain S-box-containing protein